MQFEGPGDIIALQDGLRGRDLGFLSQHMRRGITESTEDLNRRESSPAGGG